MNLALLSALVTAPLLAQPDADLRLSKLETPAVFTVTGNHFQAENPTAHSYLLVFSDDFGTARSQVMLPAGGLLSFDIPAGALRDLSLEVLAPTEFGWRKSGQAGLDLARMQPAESAILQVYSDHLDAWASTAGTARFLNRSAPLAAGASQPLGAPQAPTVQSSSTHVPSVTPIENPQDSRPPILDDDPLSAI